MIASKAGKTYAEGHRSLKIMLASIEMQFADVKWSSANSVNLEDKVRVNYVNRRSHTLITDVRRGLASA